MRKEKRKIVKIDKSFWNLISAVYQEVRKIMPETELPCVAPVPQNQENIGYILLGFKSLDKNFSQVSGCACACTCVF